MVPTKFRWKFVAVTSFGVAMLILYSLVEEMPNHLAGIAEGLFSVSDMISALALFALAIGLYIFVALATWKRSKTTPTPVDSETPPI